MSFRKFGTGEVLPPTDVEEKARREAALREAERQVERLAREEDDGEEQPPE